MENIIILGTGCAGFTAGIYTARANLSPLILEGKQPGGQLTTTSEVENFPGFPEGVDGYSLMDQLRKQAIKFGARVENAFVDKVDFSGKTKLLFAGEKTFEAKSVIIATGAAPRLLGVPGEKEMFGGKGVTTCATCDGAFYRDMEVVVVGGGDSACEEALFSYEVLQKLLLIHRRDKLRASKIMAERAMAHEKINLLWNTGVDEVIAGEDGKARAVKVETLTTEPHKKYPAKAYLLPSDMYPTPLLFKEF